MSGSKKYKIATLGSHSAPQIVNGSKNAAILAIQLLAISSKVLYKKLEYFKKTQKNTVFKRATNLESIGFKKYLLAQNLPILPIKNSS